MPDPTLQTPEVKHPSLLDLKKGLDNRVRESSISSQDPFRKVSTEGFNAAPSEYGGLNFERYYGKRNYPRLGFNPYVDNEKNYLANTTWGDDFVNATNEWSNLFDLGFSSMWSSNTDRREAQEYARSANIGTTTRGGAMGTINNTVLNSGYTVGLISEIIVEELALGALEFVTVGGATPVVAARTGTNAARLARGANTISRLSNRMTSTLARLKDLRNIGKAKNFAEGAKSLARGMNPLRGTTEFLSAGGRHFRRNSAGRIERLSALAVAQRGFGALYRDLREVNLAVDEAHLESGFVSNRTKQELTTEFLKKHGRHPNESEYEYINKASDMAARNALWNNTGLIYMTNRIAFGNFFNKWMPRGVSRLTAGASRTVRGGRLVRNLGTGTLDVIRHGGVLGYKTLINEAKYAFKASTLKKAPWAAAKFLGRYSRANVGEGVQEYFQEVIQDAEFNRARDRYYGAVAGGAWDNTFRADEYSEYYNESLDKYISAEGAEVFMSGFLMGAIAGPFSRGSQSVVKSLQSGGKYVFDKAAYDQEQSYIEQSQQELEKNVERFNEMTDGRKDFLKDYISYLSRQQGYKTNMDEASEEDSQKEFIDMKDMALVDQVLFAQSMGAYDLVVDKLRDMSKLSEEELREAFGIEAGEQSELVTDFKASYGKIIDRADQIHKMSQNFDKMFPEPQAYGEVDSELDTGIQQQDVKRAWQRAKALAIMNQHSLVRTMERMESIQREMYGDKAPFWRRDKSPPSTDITRIFSGEGILDELSLLNEEIKNLEAFDTLDPSQRRDLKYKKELSSSLKELEEGISAYQGSQMQKAAIEYEMGRRKEASELSQGRTVTYKRGTTEWSGEIVGETENKNGRPQWIIKKPNGKTVKVLKDSSGIQREFVEDVSTEEVTLEAEKLLEKYFKNYMDVIAERNDNRVDDAKLSTAFQSFKDFYNLKSDEANLSKYISLLMDPDGHVAHVERFNEMFKQERATEEETLRIQLGLFNEARENNDLVEMLLKQYRAFIQQDDLESLVTDQLVPEEFFDEETMQPIRPDSKRYQDITKAIQNWLIDTGRVDAVEETEEPGAPAGTQTAEELEAEYDLFHTGAEGLTVADITAEPRVTKQGKRGKKYGGFYAYDNLGQLTKFVKGNRGTVASYGIKLKDGVEIKEYTGEIERLDSAKIKELVDQGFRVIRGKSLLGRTELIVLDISAIESVTDVTESITAITQPAEAPKAPSVSEESGLPTPELDAIDQATAGISAAGTANAEAKTDKQIVDDGYIDYAKPHSIEAFRVKYPEGFTESQVTEEGVVKTRFTPTEEMYDIVLARVEAAEAKAKAAKPIETSTPLDQLPKEVQAKFNEALRRHNSTMATNEQLSAIARQNAQFATVEDFVTSHVGKAKLAKIVAEYNKNKGLVEDIKQTIEEAAPTRAKGDDEDVVIETRVSGELAAGEEAIEAPLQVHPEAKVPVSKEIIENIMIGDITEISLPLPPNFTNDIVKALRAVGALKAGEKLTTENAGLSVTRTVTNDRGQKIKLTFTYLGKQSLDEAGGFIPAVGKLGLPTSPTEEFSVPVTVNDETYYANSESQSLWLKGQGKQHMFGVSSALAPEELTLDVQSVMAWESEIKKSFDEAKTQHDLDSALESVIAKNVQRRIDNVGELFTEDIESLYNEAVKDLINRLDVTDFKPGEHYAMKGRLRKFGTAIVSKVTPEGVVFTSVDTQEVSSPVSKADLGKVVKSKITDMEEYAAGEAVELTPEEEKLADATKASVEEFAKDASTIGEILDEADGKSNDQVDSEFLDNLGCD